MRRIVLGAALFTAILVGIGFVLAQGAFTGEDPCIRVGGDLVVESGQDCPRDAVAIGGNLVVQGSVGKSAVAIGGSVRVRGRVTGNVVGVGGEVVLQDGALVGGHVVSFGGALQRAPAAAVRGNLLESRLLPAWSVQADRKPVAVWTRVAIAVLITGLALGACLLIAAVLRLAWPQRTNVMVGTLRMHLAHSIGMGITSSILSIVLLPLLSALLLTVVIGIPLIPMLYLVWGLGCLAGLSIAGLAVGEALAPRKTALPHWALSALGLGIVVPLAVLPGAVFPCLGFAWAVLLSSVGGGAIVLSRAGTLCSPRIHRRDSNP
jgi:hypothetical protein